jgi:hypothetical protein
MLCFGSGGWLSKGRLSKAEYGVRAVNEAGASGGDSPGEIGGMGFLVRRLYDCERSHPPNFCYMRCLPRWTPCFYRRVSFLNHGNEGDTGH